MLALGSIAVQNPTIVLASVVSFAFPASIGTHGRGIDGTGEIVGTYFDRSGNQLGYIRTGEVSTVPLPSSLLLITVGILGLSLARTRVMIATGKAARIGVCDEFSRVLRLTPRLPPPRRAAQFKPNVGRPIAPELGIRVLFRYASHFRHNN